ncbi:hypothetical protein DYI21_02520 [Thalassospira tepidiphila]|jgi:polar amino acid transport system substrate-binding protein|nr:hypothetical protein [Thalassospira tepidiphila]
MAFPQVYWLHYPPETYDKRHSMFAIDGPDQACARNRDKLCAHRFVLLVQAFFVLLATVIVAGNAQAQALEKADPSHLVDALGVTLLTEEYPPFNFLDDEGHLRGIGAEVVQAMATQLGYGKDIDVLPWKRVLLRIDGEANVGVFSMTRTPQREESYQWVGPVVPINAGIFQRADSANPVRDIEDLRQAGLIGVQAGGAAELALRSYGFENLEPIHHSGGVVGMLEKGRIDLIVSSDIELYEQLKNSTLKRDDVEMVYAFTSADLYLAFSSQTSPEIVRVWQHAYDEIVKDGQFDRIVSQYGVIMNQSPRIERGLLLSQ